MVDLKAPTCWEELSEAQLRYVLELLAMGMGNDEVQAYAFVRFTGIKVHRRDPDVGWLCEKDGTQFRLQPWEVQSFVSTLGYLSQPDKCRVRLPKAMVGGKQLHAVDAELHGYPFIDWLTLENTYQGCMGAADGRDSNTLDTIRGNLDGLCRLLYLDSEDNRIEGGTFDNATLIGALLWITGVKSLFRETFPRLFSPADGNGTYDPMASVNAQVRALTDGDVTKEKAVFATDVWRALTELEAKLRDQDELRKNTKK